MSRQNVWAEPQQFNQLKTLFFQTICTFDAKYHHFELDRVKVELWDGPEIFESSFEDHRVGGAHPVHTFFEIV
jgi:hypothetical protein